MGSFFVPLVVVVYVYFKISCVIAERHNKLEALNGPKLKVNDSARASRCGAVVSGVRTLGKLWDENGLEKTTLIDIKILVQIPKIPRKTLLFNILRTNLF